MSFLEASVVSVLPPVMFLLPFLLLLLLTVSDTSNLLREDRPDDASLVSFVWPFLARSVPGNTRRAVSVGEWNTLIGS